MREENKNECPGGLKSWFQHYHHTTTGSVLIQHETIKADHIHLLIWWFSNHAFSHSGFYQHVNRWRTDWDTEQHNPEHPPTWCHEIGQMVTTKRLNEIHTAFILFRVNENCKFDIRSKPRENFMKIQKKINKYPDCPISIVIINNVIKYLKLDS